MIHAMPVANTTPPRLTPSQIKRFHSYVERKSKAECWEWIGPLFTSGRGRVSTGSRKCQAHRIAFYIAYNKWPQDCVCHTCDNPICMNPNHLFEGDHNDNNQDRVAKNRSAIGLNNGRSKLTPNLIPSIRVALANGASYRSIGKTYNVDGATIRDIAIKRSWAWVV